MIFMHKSLSCALIAVWFLSVLMTGICHGQSPLPRDKSTYAYVAEFKLYSIIPPAGPETFRDHGNVSVEVGRRGEAGIQNLSQNLRVVATGRTKDRRFLVDFSVQDLSKGKATAIESLSREIELTDLKPESVEIARDADGRIYRVNIVPRVNEYPATKPFSSEAMHWDHWSLIGSSLILNDQDYLGTLGIAGGNLAFVDVPGLAKVEFSLIPLKGSTGDGVLQDGTITIRHEQTTLAIKNVRNGQSAETLKGGPYTVFVRWNPPTLTIEQYREQLKETIQQLKARLDGGDTTIPAEALNRLQRSVDSDRVFLINTGLSTASSTEIDQSLLETKGDKK